MKNWYALVGSAVAETLRILGTIKDKDIIVLIEGGSTHNFIQDRVIKFLSLQVS